MNLIPKPNGNIIYKDGVFKGELPFSHFKGDFASSEAFGLVNCEEADLSFEKMSGMEDESYVIDVYPDSVMVRASSDAGLLCGMQTLRQLAEKGSLECMHLEDYPRFQYRGFMIDVCRHFFSVNELKKLIREASGLKLNHLHLHLSDNEGYRIESRVFPELNRTGSFCNQMPGKEDEINGYYKQDEITELVAYAKTYGIEIVPEIDLPAHSLSVARSYPELTCHKNPVSEWTDEETSRNVMCAGDDSTYIFLCELLDEVMELFPGKYIHIGGDEAQKDFWESCPCCQKKMKEENISDTNELQAYFVKRIAEHVISRNRIPVGWNDTARAGKQIQGLVCHYWSEEGENYFADTINDETEIICSNAPYFYLDYSHAMTHIKSLYSYEPHVKGYGPLDKKHVLGVESELWTEWIHNDRELEEKLFPRLIALSENAWTEDRDYGDFRKRLVNYTEGLKNRGVSCTGLTDAEISGEEAVSSCIEEGKKLINIFRRLDMPEDLKNHLIELAAENVMERVEISYGKEYVTVARNELYGVGD